MSAPNEWQPAIRTWTAPTASDRQRL